MSPINVKCPKCGTRAQGFKNPTPTVDILIEVDTEDQKTGIVLIERKNPPPGWAIPGGFLDYGETLEQAAVREAKEETSLDVELMRQFHTYSDPARDPREHTVTTVFIAKAPRGQQPAAQSDARKVGIFTKDNLPDLIAFDHRQILEDYFSHRY